MVKSKIVYLCTNADLAGAPIHVRKLILGFQQRADIQAIFGENSPLVEELESAGIKCYVFARMRSNISPINDLISLYQLIILLLKIKPDLIHIHSTKAGMIGRLACHITQTPWVYTIHGWGWRGFGKIRSGIIFIIEKILSFTYSGFYIYVSESVAKDGLEKLKITSNRSKVIFNGVEDYGFRQEPFGPLRILMAARVCIAKDHETLIRAFNCLNIPSKLILCGKDTNSNNFRKLVILWAPQRYSDIELLGVCDDVPKLMQSINVYALVSNFEALPLSIIEAMACSRAVIASDVGGVNELIKNNESGLTIPLAGIQELTIGLNRLQDANYRSYLAKNARLRYESNFHEFNMLEAIWEVYRGVIDSQKHIR
jgi:glycosyltransferase involved in cell wall biosynthesis